MKRAIAFVLFIAIVFVMFGCESKPPEMSDTFYNAGKKVLEIVDQYLDFDISAEDACDRISEINDILPESNSSGETCVSIYIFSLENDFRYLDSTFSQFKTDYNGILEDRNKLAKWLWVDER